MNFLSTETFISLFSLSEIQPFNTNLPSSHSLNKCRLPHTSTLQRNEKSNLSECLINESMSYQDETTGGDGLWPSELVPSALFHGNPVLTGNLLITGATSVERVHL